MKRALRPLLCSTRNTKYSSGCRLLDYTSPATHSSVPKSKFLLSSRFGFRYENQELYQEHAELLTIAELLRRKEVSKEAAQWPTIRFRLGLAPDFKLEDLRHAGYSLTHVNIWVDCIQQNTLLDAMKVISAHPETPWPGFVVLYTFGRHVTSSFEVYEAVRLYQSLLPELPYHLQPELVALVLKCCRRKLLDLTPLVVRTFLNVCKDQNQELAAPIVNELLWIVASFGKNWSTVDTGILTDAQELLVRAAGSDKIDAKGIFALSYVTHFKQPQVARSFMNELKALVVSRTPPGSAKDFAYSNGPAVINMLTSSTAEEALRILDETSIHKPAMWTCGALYLSRAKLLTSDVALRLWAKALGTKTRVTSLFTELVLGSILTLHSKQRVLAHALAAGIRLSPSLVARMMKVNTKSELDEAMALYPQFVSNRLVSEQILSTQGFCDPGSAWATYCRIRDSQGQPSRRALHTLCRAAWDTKLIWDGMYASQLALAEFKMHVRGLSVPADDLLRLFPDEKLLYAYIVMAGRAGYTKELVGFLSWVEDIGLKPSKLVLMALIHYSPQGPALLKLGQNARPPSSEWPSEEDYNLYVQMLEA